MNFLRRGIESSIVAMRCGSVRVAVRIGQGNNILPPKCRGPGQRGWMHVEDATVSPCAHHIEENEDRRELAETGACRCKDRHRCCCALIRTDLIADRPRINQCSADRDCQGPLLSGYLFRFFFANFLHSWPCRRWIRFCSRFARPAIWTYSISYQGIPETAGGSIARDFLNTPGTGGRHDEHEHNSGDRRQGDI
jgi:hypothetical protein